MLALLLLIKLLQMYNNIKRVAWDYDIVLFITERFETFRNNFKHMPADELPNVSSAWAIMYDDRRDVWIEMGGRFDNRKQRHGLYFARWRIYKKNSLNCMCPPFS